MCIRDRKKPVRLEANAARTRISDAREGFVMHKNATSVANPTRLERRTPIFPIAVCFHVSPGPSRELPRVNFKIPSYGLLVP